MSYEIEYDHVFILSKHGITPCQLIGSNNCYEGTRRVREWCVFMNLLGASEQEILDTANSLCNGLDHWKHNGKWVDDKGLMRWAKAGIRHCYVIEGILAANGWRAVWCNAYVYDKNGAIETTISDTVSDTASFDRWIDDVCQFKQQHPDKEVIPVVDWWDKDSIRKPSVSKFDENDEVILKSKNSYLYMCCRRSDNKSYSSFWGTDIKKALVLTKRDADIFANEYYNRNHTALQFISAERVMDPYNTVIKFTTGDLAGTYFVKNTKKTLYYSILLKDAKRFPTEAAARRSAKNMNNGAVIETIPV